MSGLPSMMPAYTGQRHEIPRGPTPKPRKGTTGAMSLANKSATAARTTGMEQAPTCVCMLPCVGSLGSVRHGGRDKPVCSSRKRQILMSDCASEAVDLLVLFLWMLQAGCSGRAECNGG
ncbi:hypothetical protein PG994_000729 [Apiospora phragmitis]|uniref:Uncharacterized protein n=1 Tax=Apiospora phragmitis TaxID=2905665 RepID=A0ABR1X734_9PEZI